MNKQQKTSTLGQLWKFLNTDVTTEGVKGGVEAADKVFKLVKTLKDQSNSHEIGGLVSNISTLVDVLNSPIGQVVGASLPFVSLGAGLLKYYVDKTKEEPSLEYCAAIIVQVAYLDSVKNTLDQDLMDRISDKEAGDVIQEKINKLKDLEFGDRDAREALIYFADSKLAQAFNEVLAARLQEVGIAEDEAKTWTQKVSTNTPQYTDKAVAEAGDGVNRLVEWYRIGGKETFERYLSIETYLKEQIESLPDQKVFDEKCSIKDIYVSLKSIPLDANGKKVKNVEPLILEDWAKDILEDPNKKGQVIFIQGGPGRGKTVFCKMFAHRVFRELYPIFIPIFIRLRDIISFQQSFEKTLGDALGHVNFVSNYSGWLTNRNIKYLFILDGFDELRMEGRKTGGVERFIEQVGKFQKQFQTSETGHRVIITGRSLALQGISYLPSNLERVELLKMDKPLQEEWLEKWQKVVNPDDIEDAKTKTNAFKDFLQAQECPTEVKEELATEPLLLYLLAAMHRDGQIKISDFQSVNQTQAKILIYEKSLEWVLTKQRPENVQHSITNLKPENLQRILIEAALCVVQSGGEYANVKMIRERLEKDEREMVKSFNELVKDEQGDKVLTTALAAFYIKPAAGEKEGGVEFYHKSFSEFLCAKRLHESLIEWTEKGGRNQKFIIDEQKLAEQIYDLLGYGGLSSEIVKYLVGLLVKSQESQEEFLPRELFQRLSDFYERWSYGEFIDAEGTTLPQTKMRQLKGQISNQQLGQRQVDVYAGLNVMILLLELVRYDQAINNSKATLKFYPCGKVSFNGSPENPLLLNNLIGYSSCIGSNGFINTIGANLSGANLSGANLSGAFLQDASLQDANLSGANLSGAFLKGASLFSADLQDADLQDANLSGASLSGASLLSADLQDANLSGAFLSGANLKGANLEDANLSGAFLSGANLKDANLKDANLKDANLKDANLKDANLSGADLSGAFLKGADLSGADLSGADLSGADLSGADLSGADLKDANLKDANLKGAFLSGANLKDANLKDADLSGANLKDADLSGANLKDADLSGAFLKDADLSGAFLSGIFWNEYTNWISIKNIDKAKQIPETLKRQLGLSI